MSEKKQKTPMNKEQQTKRNYTRRYAKDFNIFTKLFQIYALNIIFYHLLFCFIVLAKTPGTVWNKGEVGRESSCLFQSWLEMLCIFHLLKQCWLWLCIIQTFFFLSAYMHSFYFGLFRTFIYNC